MRTRAVTLLASLLSPLAQADEPTRDPTAWPPALRSAVAAAQAASGASTPGARDDQGIRQVVFTGGNAFVVQRGRRYALGEALDGARIERITEQAVWLRDAGGQVRREALYGSVEKRPAAAPPALPASGAKKSKEKP